MKLYHATDLNSALNATKTQLGLDRKYYKNYIKRIAKVMNVDPEFLLSHKTIKELLSASEVGSVSFFPKWKQGNRIVSFYKKGGEVKKVNR